MTQTRREQIEAMLLQQPQDRMLRYMLAMECMRDNDSQRSLSLFRELMTEDYVPAYFRAAQQLVTLDETDDARTVLRSGIELARQQGDPKTAGEMSELLASLGRAG